MWLKIPIDLETDAANVYLLPELDRWIALGLLSKEQTLSLGRKLCSPLPIGYKVPTEVTEEPVELDPVTRPETMVTTSVSPGKPIFSRFKSHLVQSFLAEVSVLWLLFLGVFLVVVSSGVLAASQWQSFSTVGQYGILLVYTLAFGGASFWAARQAKLQTTAHMLKAATLLLIPLNLWMMDALGLAKASAGLAGLATISLSALTLALAPHKKAGLNLMGLSWLHWGWGITPWPLIATYLGTTGSAINLVQAVPEIAVEDNRQPELRSGDILVAIALLILLVRSVWIAQIPMAQLGLAIGICGWMLCRLRQYPLWPQIGAGLMLIGWLVAIGQQPIQAIGISGLASWLLLARLRQQTQERAQLHTLAILWLVGLQACGLLWLTLPLAFRQVLLTALGHLSPDPVSTLQFAGLWLYGYVSLMLMAASQFQRNGQTAWSRLTAYLALSISALLVLWASPQIDSVLFTASLLGLTLTVGSITHLYRGMTPWLIYGTHSAAVVTILSGIHVLSQGLGGWSEPQWAMVLIALTTLEWLSNIGIRHLQWRQSAWYLGLGLGVIAYSLLFNNWGSWLNLIWLVIPGVLTVLAYRQPVVSGSPQITSRLTVIALGGQLLLVSSWPMATIAWFIGAGLLFLHSCRWPTQKALPTLAIGFAVWGSHTASIWLWAMAEPWPNVIARLCLVTALLASALSLLARSLEYRSKPLLQVYGIVSRNWGQALAITLNLSLTLIIVLIYALGLDSIHWLVGIQSTEWVLRYGIAAIIVVLASLFNRRRLTNLNFWELAHGIGLLVTMGLLLWRKETNPHLLGTVMVALAVITQLMGTVSVAKKQHPYPSSWHYIPLAYGALGLGLSHLSFTITTGIYAAVVGIVTLSIGRRQVTLHPWGYGGLGLLSLGLYELMIYRLLQASGGAIGDGFTLLAWMGGAIAAFYLLCHRWIQRYSQLSATNIGIVSLLHWLLAVVLATIAMVSGHSRWGLVLWLGITSLLALYAELRGNYRWFPNPNPNAEQRHQFNRIDSHKQWTWSGLIIATVAIPYGIMQTLPNLTFIRGWGALLICGLSLIIHRLPWQQWGWPIRPWQKMALSWPLLSILLSIFTIKTQGLLLGGAFYAFMARRIRAVRLSYLSLALLNWALIRYLLDQGWLTLLWAGIILGLSGLYILEVDPRWQTISARQERHRLRSFATLLIGLTAIFQAETASPIIIGLSLLISFGFISFGLATQVRAYLYTGTLTFALQILRTIAIFISTDGRMLWAIGIMLGITLIWIAATFEARRTQISQLLNQWSEMLQNWD